MKTLVIIRHAKSKDALIGQLDFDRELSHEGEVDAKMMAQKLRDENILVDAFIASAAKRTQSTAKIFMKELAANEHQFFPTRNLYEAPVTEYYKAIQQLNDNWETVAIFGHNPGITYFINSLDTKPIHHMPPAGMYVVKIDADSWKDISSAEKKFLFFKTVERI